MKWLIQDTIEKVQMHQVTHARCTPVIFLAIIFNVTLTLLKLLNMKDGDKRKCTEKKKAKQRK